MSNLLLTLLEACAQHKRHHEDDGEHHEESAERLKKCRKDLQSLSRVLPLIERTIAVPDRRRDDYRSVGSAPTASNDGDETSGRATGDTNENDVRHLCAVYRAIARDAFCPHAANVFFGGSDFTADEASASDVAIARGILPRILRLMRYWIVDPVREANAHLRIEERRTSLEEDVNAFYQEEDMGATVASLLNLLQGKKIRVSAINDLIDLANDLNTVEDSSVLFDPSLSRKHSGDNDNSMGKIRISVFTQLIGHLNEESSDDVVENKLHLSSRRSLLSLQLGVWTILYHFSPLDILDNDALQYAGKYSTNTGGYIDKVGLLNSLLAASRPILQLSSRGNLPENQIGTWVYSEDDVKIHSALVLRTKLVISGLLRCIVTAESSSKLSRGVRGDLSAPFLGGVFQNSGTVELALLSIETLKSHAVWNHSFYSDRLDCTRDNIEEQLSIMCSWSISNLVIFTILFPGNNLSSTDFWVHVFPYLVDCVPFIVDRYCRLQDHQKCLTRVVLRVLHVLLLRHGEAVTLFMNRCLAQGYFPYLFELASDSFESVSGPAISIINFLLEPSFHKASEIKNCFNEETTRDGPIHSHVSVHVDRDIGDANVDDQSKLLVQAGRKRRRLLDDNPCVSLRTEFRGASIYATLVHFIKEAVTKADDLISSVEKRLEMHSSRDGPKVVSLITVEDLPKLSFVSGLIRILMSLRSAMSSSAADDSIENAIGHLFVCLQNFSNVLASHEKNGGICHIEPRILLRSLSLIASVGHHAYRVETTPNQPKNYSERESITYCVMATLPLVNFNDSVELDDDVALDLWTKTESKAYCQKLCCHLCSVIGVTSMSPSDICLCRLVRDTSNLRISRECGAFLVDDVLPLSFR